MMKANTIKWQVKECNLWLSGYGLMVTVRRCTFYFYLYNSYSVKPLDGAIYFFFS